MAKTQNLSLNPTKISGTCGRLMCCLNYEQEAYEDLLRTSPKVESFVDTPDGRGTVTEVNLLKQSVNVRLEKQPETIVCHKNCDICVLRNGKAKKTDAPIPEDLAPISGKAPKKKAEAGFSTYLEPVVLRRSAETLAESVTSLTEEPEETPKSRRRHGNRGGKPKGEAVQEKAPKEAKQEPGKGGKKQKDRRASKPQEKPAKPEAPKKPKAEAPKKEGAEAPKKEGAEAPKAKKNRYPYHRRRKPGNKTEG